MNYPYMPKSTALWLIENTALTFEQIADFCGLHELEVKNIADSETQKLQGLDPILSGQLTRENIKECEADPSARLKLCQTIIDAQDKQKKQRVYVSKVHRQNRQPGILWILMHYPVLSNAQIARLMRSTSKTIQTLRETSGSLFRGKNSKDFDDDGHDKIANPIVLGLIKESDLLEEVEKAEKKANKQK